jgi:hypothetical protein
MYDIRHGTSLINRLLRHAPGGWDWMGGYQVQSSWASAYSLSLASLTPYTTSRSRWINSDLLRSASLAAKIVRLSRYLFCCCFVPGFGARLMTGPPGGLGFGLVMHMNVRVPKSDILYILIWGCKNDTLSLVKMSPSQQKEGCKNVTLWCIRKAIHMLPIPDNNHLG